MNAEPEVIDDEPQLDRTAFSVVCLTDPDDSLEYWLSRPVVDRLRAIQQLRRTFYGSSASEGFQRVIEVAKLERR
jgi:hypothetical protein